MSKIIVNTCILGVCMSTFDIQGDYHRSEDVDVKIKEVGIAEQHITASCTKVSRMNNEMFIHGLSNVHPR